MNAPPCASSLEVQPPQVQASQTTPTQPARWKMTLVLWMMVYPIITGLGLALDPLLRDRPMVVRNLVLTAIFVPAMVYGGVPAARKLVVELDAQQKR